MKNKILNLAKSAVWFVLCLFVGALILRAFALWLIAMNLQRRLVCQYSQRKDTIIWLWTRNMVFALFTQKVALVVKKK